MTVLYKIMSAALWETAQAKGRVPWAAVDEADGFVHLSNGAQVRETALRYFTGQDDLVLLTLDPSRFPPGSLRWEPSRGGALFPHVYGDIPLEAVTGVAPLPAVPGGFEFPPDVP